MTEVSVQPEHELDSIWSYITCGDYTACIGVSIAMGSSIKSTCVTKRNNRISASRDTQACDILGPLPTPSVGHVLTNSQYGSGYPIRHGNSRLAIGR